MTLVYFITHPDVEIDPSVPVPEWRLSPMGLARMRTFARQPRLSNIGWIYSSSERKAMDGASILSAALGVPNTVREALGENDRSATGYLPRAEFEETAKRFFSSPRASIRGWERAIDAQTRIVEALDEIREHNDGALDVAVVSHGGVGALLLCHIKQIEITPEENQPGTTGGNYFIFDQKSRRLMMDWQSID